MTKATVIADASHCGHSHVGGWAAWVRVDNFRIPIKGYGTIKGTPPTPTVAEMYAALNGVWLATQYGATDILLRTDCLAVVNLVHGTIKSKKLLHEWRTATKGATWLAGITLDARHVPGHVKVTSAATFVQDWCDTKSRYAMKQARLGRRVFEVTP